MGRARGVNAANTLLIELHGGYDSDEMDQALAAHGVVINERTVNTLRGHGKQSAIIAEAVDTLESNGITASVRTVGKLIRDDGKTMSRNMIMAELANMRETGRLNHIAKNQ